MMRKSRHGEADVTMDPDENAPHRYAPFDAPRAPLMRLAAMHADQYFATMASGAKLLK